MDCSTTTKPCSPKPSVALSFLSSPAYLIHSDQEQQALFGLRTDLGLTIGDRYSFSAAIFYLGFIVGSTPAVLLAQRYPIERVCAAIVAVWGVCLMCTAACRNYQGLYAQRFFLGFLESGVSPMFMLVVGGWYKRGEQALRMGIWYCASEYPTLPPVPPIFSPRLDLLADPQKRESPLPSSYFQQDKTLQHVRPSVS
jgi:MFS family permease